MPAVRTVELAEDPRVVLTERGIFGEAMACGCTTFDKQPGEDLDYTIDWSRWLASDTIATSTWVVDTGLTIGAGPKAPSNTPFKTTIWLSGGDEGVIYKVTNTVVTTLGRTSIVCFKVRVKTCDGC